jgi:hypothetical protein
VPVIFSFIDNPNETTSSYETAQIRRVCSDLFLTLLRHNAIDVVKHFQHDKSIRDWFSRVDKINDERLRVSAIESRDILSRYFYMLSK